jgi:hypothetical protein
MHRLGQRDHTYNLGQVQGVISNGVEHEILQPVDHVEELLAQRSHGVGGVCGVLLPTAGLDADGRLAKSPGAASGGRHGESGGEGGRRDGRFRVPG